MRTLADSEEVVAAQPIERLEADLVSLASQLTAATARFVQMVGEYDERAGWRAWGMKSCALWLSWKCGLGPTSAREHVRVARALRSLPTMASEFAAGRLSYSKVRAMTRVATPDTEAALTTAGLYATAAQIEQLVRLGRAVRRRQDAAERHRQRFVHICQDPDGSYVGSFRLPPEQGAVLQAALDAGRGRLPEQIDEEPRTPVQGAADALVALASAFLGSVPAGTSDEATAGGDSDGGSDGDKDGDADGDGDGADGGRGIGGGGTGVELVLHATIEALAAEDDEPGAPAVTLGDGTRLHPSTGRRLTCDCRTSELVDGSGRSPLHLGRRTRRIRGRLLRAVHCRDGGRCVAPGCDARARQVHHLEHWSRGGPRCLPNLASLCDAHHWLVHEGGFSLRMAGESGGWILTSPHGRVVGPTPEPLPAAGEELRDDGVAADAVTGGWDGTRIDFGDAVGIFTNAPAKPMPQEWIDWDREQVERLRRGEPLLSRRSA